MQDVIIQIRCLSVVGKWCAWPGSQGTMVSWLRSWHAEYIWTCQVEVLIRKRKESWSLGPLRTKEFEGIDCLTDIPGPAARGRGGIPESCAFYKDDHSY